MRDRFRGFRLFSFDEVSVLAQRTDIKRVNETVHFGNRLLRSDLTGEEIVLEMS